MKDSQLISTRGNRLSKYIKVNNERFSTKDSGVSATY